MSIRSVAKAIIVKENCVLLNRCHHEDGSVYYALPGGGQHQYESLEDAVRREVREETGYEVSELRFCALAEEIYTDEELRVQHSDYTHRILHIFYAGIADNPRDIPSEKDFEMETSEWIPVERIAELPEICPKGLQKFFPQIMKQTSPVYFGTYYLD